MANKNLFVSGSWIVFGIFALTVPAHGQSSAQPDELQAIYACKSISSADKRLDCYDKSVGRFEAAEKSGEVVTVSKIAIDKVERDAFGFNIPSLPSLGGLFGKQKPVENTKEKNERTYPVKEVSRDLKKKKLTTPPAIQNKPIPSKIEEVSLKVRKTTTFGKNKIRFFMSNGQVWEQVGTTRTRIRKIETGENQSAEISKAALGSFFLRVNGKGSAIRVRRVR